MAGPGATVDVYSGLCKLTLTASCGHLLDLMENALVYICFTHDNTNRQIREHKPIAVVKCINVKKDFSTLLFSNVLKRSSLPSSIFQFYAKDPTEDDSTPVTMASIFQFLSASQLDSDLAEYVEKRILTSVTFTRNFYYHAMLRGKLASYKNENVDCHQLILIRLIPPKGNEVQLVWSHKLQVLLCKRLQLLDAMNWLNTLGGGYSALGDCMEYHSLKAAEISTVQLGVALEMGDPPTILRCYLYFALSLMQRGRVRTAKYMLRYLYCCALTHRETDPKLVNMCLGLWSRLRFFYSVYRQRRRHKHSNKHSNGVVNHTASSTVFTGDGTGTTTATLNHTAMV